MTTYNEQVERKLVEKDKVILPEDERENVLITSALPCGLVAGIPINSSQAPQTATMYRTWEM